MLTAIRSTCFNEGKDFYYSLSVSITILQGFAKSFHCYLVLYTYQAIVLAVRLVSILIPLPRGNPSPVFPSGRKCILSFAPLNRDRLHTSCIIFLCIFFLFFFFTLRKSHVSFLDPGKGILTSFTLLAFSD